MAEEGGEGKGAPAASLRTVGVVPSDRAASIPWLEAALKFANVVAMGRGLWNRKMEQRWFPLLKVESERRFPRIGSSSRTDYTRWRFRVHTGRRPRAPPARLSTFCGLFRRPLRRVWFAFCLVGLSIAFFLFDGSNQYALVGVLYEFGITTGCTARRRC